MLPIVIWRLSAPEVACACTAKVEVPDTVHDTLAVFMFASTMPSSTVIAMFDTVTEPSWRRLSKTLHCGSVCSI